MIWGKKKSEDPAKNSPNTLKDDGREREKTSKKRHPVHPHASLSFLFCNSVFLFADLMRFQLHDLWLVRFEGMASQFTR